MWVRWKDDHSDIEIHYGPLEARETNMARDNFIIGRADSLGYRAVPNVVGVGQTLDSLIRVEVYKGARGWANGVEATGLPLATVDFDAETARSMARSLNEQADALESNQPAVYEVTVRIPVERAPNANHAKNLAAAALEQYRSKNGRGGSMGQVVGEPKVLTKGQLKSSG